MLRELFATPPSEFVTARNELAKGLRKEKRREEATAVAALRRPGWDDWALNVAATEHGDEVSAFADAAAAVRDAQSAAIEGRDGPDVRSALADLRERTARVVKVAGSVLGRVGRQAAGGELNGRLAEVAGSEEAVEQLRGGVLGIGGDAPAELFAGLQPATDERPASRSAAPSRSRSAPPTTSTEGDAEVARRDRDRRAEQDERRRRKDALRAATQARRESTRVLARADAELDAARAVVRRAERALADAQRAVAEAERDRDEAAEAVATIDADIEQARAELDGGSGGGEEGGA